MVYVDSEIHREEKGKGSRRGMVPPARIRELRENARCAINITPIDRIAEDYDLNLTVSTN